jgi:hypothetical protein
MNEHISPYDDNSKPEMNQFIWDKILMGNIFIRLTNSLVNLLVKLLRESRRLF